jgi:hypothetical protein
VYDAITIEERGVPALAIVNKNFAQDAASAAAGKGMPGLRIMPEKVPSESTIPDQIEAGIYEVMDDIFALITTPLSEEERSPKKKDEIKHERIIFSGSIEEVNRFFYKRGWTDGLPVLPPTEEAVQEMLTGTDLPPDHVVTKIIPRMGKATVEKIAINAVMAGALPTYMPLLVAGVQAIMDRQAFFGTWEVSTGSWSPCWIINGPVRKDLHINSGVGTLSPGDMANAAFGRAMGLIIKNIGGARKGVEDMGVLGNPMKYAMVMAENEEDSPWEPLHVEYGYNKSDSTVTVFFPNSYSQIWHYSSDDAGILRTITSNAQPGRGGLCCLMITPEHAKTLAENNWTKQEIRDHVAEYARVPAYLHPNYWGSFFPVKARPPANREDPVGIFKSNLIRIVVMGGHGAFIGMAVGGGSNLSKEVDFAMKKIELPGNWDKLVAKYKGLAPVYARE